MSISDEKEVKSKVVAGAIWKLLEKTGMTFIQFLIQIVLARLLLPEDYGLVGLLTIFMTISDVFLLQGFTTALIQKKDADELDFSSVFFANLIMAVVIYIVFFLSAPLVATFYKEERLVLIMRVLSLNVIAGAFAAVHNSVMAKNLEFKKSFFRVAANVVTQGLVGIACALLGFGVWSLVVSKLAGTTVGTIVICTTVKWRPKFLFSIKRLKKLFSYSSKVLVVNLVNVVFNNIHSLIIGRYFTKAELGYYQRGQQFPTVLTTAIDGSLSEVLYPTLSRIQDDLEKVKATLRRSMKTSMFVVLPMLLGLIAISEELILLLLTEKWLPCIPYLQLTCVVCAFWPLAARTQALNALGMSNVTFKLSMISKVLTLLLIMVCVRFGIYAILLGTILSSCVTVWLTSHYISKYIHYTIKEFLLDLLPSVAISVVMMLLVMLLGRILEVNLLLKIAIQVIFGGGVYITLSKIFRVDSLAFVLDMIKKLTRR